MSMTSLRKLRCWPTTNLSGKILRPPKINSGLSRKRRRRKKSRLRSRRKRKRDLKNLEKMQSRRKREVRRRIRRRKTIFLEVLRSSTLSKLKRKSRQREFRRLRLRKWKKTMMTLCDGNNSMLALILIIKIGFFC